MPTTSKPNDHAADLRLALVDNLVTKGAIVSRQAREAFASVPRHLFVPNVDVAAAYSDQPVFIRWDAGIPISSSTQPTMMAIMAEQLRLEPGCRVLEIGAGTGYNAAILAHIVGESGHVVTVDIDRDIVDEAAGNLSNAGYHDVEAVCRDGFEGFAAGQPYDRIMVTVGAQDVSPHWVEQLRDGGSWSSPYGSGVTVSAWPCKGVMACSKVCPSRRACSSQSAVALTEPRAISPSGVLPMMPRKCTWGWNGTTPTTVVCWRGFLPKRGNSWI